MKEGVPERFGYEYGRHNLLTAAVSPAVIECSIQAVLKGEPFHQSAVFTTIEDASRQLRDLDELDRLSETSHQKPLLRNLQ